ncbi:MAG: ABC transporter ATP-binding protein [Eubacteriales bacterium]|nr:ABC transporter ATP-binding protein [Eubacteriales bacterium]
MNTFLTMENITKKFGDVYANRAVDLSVMAGEVHTLLGENGAGKSTLMNILSGLYHPTKGHIYLRGHKVKIHSPAQAVKLGIGMVHQHYMLVEAMTVFENIILGTTKHKSFFIQKDKIKNELLALSAKYGLDIEIDKPINEISVGAQQRVEIMKALYRGAELLILDEPTAALTDIEVESLFRIIRRLTSEQKTVIFISHKMREVLEISDRITILRAGQTIATLIKSETTAAELAHLMIGRELITSEYEKKTVNRELILQLDQASFNATSKHNGLNAVSLTVGAGEVLGIAGVDGNGQSQLAQLVTGLIAPDDGDVHLNNRKVARFTPAHFIASKVSHIPEDRNKMGLIGNMTVKENLLLKSLNSSRFSYGKGWLLRRRQIAMHAREIRQTYDIRCASVEQEIRNLSGGNQQKTILARELERDIDLLVAVHPTRGLDIGATKYVHDKVIEARDRGCGVLLISADFDEVLKLSDRIAVMFEGEIVGVFPGINPPIHEISLAMAGKKQQTQDLAV